MPLGKEHYTTFAETSIRLGHSYLPEQQKSAACDRIFNLMIDELRQGSMLNVTRRALAIGKYLSAKRTMGTEWYYLMPVPEKVRLREYTLASACIEQDESPIGRNGEFHRALLSVFNESVEHMDKTAAYMLWLNNVLLQLNDDLNVGASPTVYDTTAYRINAGPLVVNEGDPIDAAPGDRIDLYTVGIGFLSVQWQLDTVDISGAVEENYRNSSVVVGDTGEYVAIYSNANGDTSSESFNVVVV